MRAVGNGVAARAFGAEATAAKPSRHAPAEAKLAYARRKYEDCVFGVPTYDKAVGAGVQAGAPIAPVPARAPAVTAAAPMAPVATLAPQPNKPSAAKADGWELIELFEAPAAPAAPVAVASTAAVTAARATAPASAAPPVAHGCAPPAPATAPVGRDTAEVLRLFDPLPPLSQPPRKPTIASDGDAFFANFGL